MKIQIDVSDFYLDEDYNLENGLKKHIIYEAIRSISEKIKEKVDSEIKQEVEKHILENLADEISKIVSNGKVKRKTDNIAVTISEYVQDSLLNSNSSWQSFDKTIREVAKNFCDEMKKRYDLAFASNIVANLVNNKMIKDEVVKLAIGGEKCANG